MAEMKGIKSKQGVNVSIGISLDIRQFAAAAPVKVRPQVVLPPGVTTEQSSSTVTLSSKAKALAAQKLDKDDPVRVKAESLRAVIQKINFKSVTPQAMSELAVKLYESGELPVEDTARLIGIEGHTEPPRSATEPIDVVAHFRHMQQVIETAARTDSTLDWGAAYARRTTQVVANLQSFARSDRLHVNG